MIAARIVTPQTSAIALNIRILRRDDQRHEDEGQPSGQTADEQREGRGLGCNLLSDHGGANNKVGQLSERLRQHPSSPGSQS